MAKANPPLRAGAILGSCGVLDATGSILKPATHSKDCADGQDINGVVVSVKLITWIQVAV